MVYSKIYWISSVKDEDIENICDSFEDLIKNKFIYRITYYTISSNTFVNITLNSEINEVQFNRFALRIIKSIGRDIKIFYKNGKGDVKWSYISDALKSTNAKKSVEVINRFLEDDDDI